MKEAELRQHASCSMCRKPIGASGLPLFYRVTVERFGLDRRALIRQQGLTMVLGNARLAAIMGPDEDMAAPVMDPAVLTVCEVCSTRSTCIAALPELVAPQLAASAPPAPDDHPGAGCAVEQPA